MKIWINVHFPLLKSQSFPVQSWKCPGWKVKHSEKSKCPWTLILNDPLSDVHCARNTSDDIRMGCWMQKEKLYMVNKLRNAQSMDHSVHKADETRHTKSQVHTRCWYWLKVAGEGAFRLLVDCERFRPRTLLPRGASLKHKVKTHVQNLLRRSKL